MVSFYNPVRVVSGVGACKSFTEIGKFGRKAIIVCGKNSARACGALGDMEALLQEAGVEYIIFDKIMQNPVVSVCDEGGKLAYKFGAAFVIGIGGGSPLDASKAVAVFAANPQISGNALYDYPLEKRNRALPIVAVGTTAGTGSEVTQYAVLTVPEIENKRTYRDTDTFPNLALMDPAYTYSLPRRFTISTAVDALAHAIEGSLLKSSSPYTDGAALEACRLISNALRQIKEGKLDEQVRVDLLTGSTLAGQVIAQTGTSFVHAAGYMLTYFRNLPHGEANAVFLADFIEFSRKAAPERVAALLAACGVKNARELEELYAPMMELDFELGGDEVKKWAAIAFENKNNGNGLRVATVEELEAMIGESKFRK